MARKRVQPTRREPGRGQHAPRAAAVLPQPQAHVRECPETDAPPQVRRVRGPPFLGRSR